MFGIGELRKAISDERTYVRDELLALHKAVNKLKDNLLLVAKPAWEATHQPKFKAGDRVRYKIGNDEKSTTMIGI